MNGFPKRASNPSRSRNRAEIVLELPTVRKMLPLVRHIIQDLLAAERQLGALLWEQDGLDRNRRTLSWPERQRRYFLQDETARLEQLRRDAVTELKGLGVEVTDPASGRVGFPTIVNAKPAYFSWQPEEDDVRFWHYVGDNDRRRPIPASWAKEAPLASPKRR